jgi:hypothetical protein
VDEETTSSAAAAGSGDKVTFPASIELEIDNFLEGDNLEVESAAEER